MAVNYEGTIPVDKYLEKFLNALFGTLSSRLILSGLGFLTFGFWDVIVFAWETKVLDRNVAPPGGEMGWSEWLGLTLLVLGIVMSVTKSIVSYFVSRADDLAERKINLLEGHHALTDVRLQHELWKVYKIRNAHTHISRRVLDHPTNKMGVMDLFKKCYLNVKCDDNDWLCLKGWAFELRYWIGFLFFLATVALFVSTLVLASFEYASPGITASGSYAFESYLVLAIIIFISNWLMLSDLTKMGTALNLVKNYKPV